MKSIYKILGIAILLSIATFLQAQIEKSKTFSGTFDDLSELAINHQRGTLNVYKATDGKTRYEATILIKAKEEESAAVMLERFSLKEDTFDGKLEISSDFGIENWSTINGKTKIKFKDGMKISGIQEVKVDMAVYIGNKMKLLHLKNKYDEIRIHDNLACNMDIEMYSGKLRTVDLAGNITLKMKYSKGEMKNLGDAKMDIYDSDIVMGNAGKIQIDSKYSSYKMGNISELCGQTYDDKFELGNVGGALVLEDKYSEFQLGNFQTGKLDFHDAEFKAGNGETVEIKSKYSEFVFENVGAIEFEDSFDDELKAKEINTFSANSKYSEFVFQRVKESASIVSSFDDKLEIVSMGANFKLLKLDGKYSDLTVDMTDGSAFHLTVDMTYGKVNFDEKSFETQIWKDKESSKKEIVGKTKGATDKSGKIVILGFDNTIFLK